MRAGQRTLSYNGETRTLREWAQRMGVSHQVLRYRLDAGWAVEEALSTPIQPRGLSESDFHARRTDDEARLRMSLVRAHFAQLVKDIDRALVAFERQLSTLSGDRGVVANIEEKPKDRATSPMQDSSNLEIS
jgi:hypothetical protein